MLKMGKILGVAYAILDIWLQSKIVGFLYEKPDMYDVELTRKLVDVSRIMAIPLLDNIIVGAVDSAGGKRLCVNARKRRSRILRRVC